MAANNLVVLMGRLGRDPEIKTTNSGALVVNFTLAVSRPYKNGDERVTDWINCCAWRNTADFIAKYFHKGDPISVVGAIQTRQWTDSDGQTRYATEVNISDAMFCLGRKQSGEKAAGAAQTGGEGSAAPPTFRKLTDVDESELPF